MTKEASSTKESSVTREALETKEASERRDRLGLLIRINVLSIGIMSLPSSNRCIIFCLCKMYAAMVLIVRYCHALLLITSKCKD